MLETNKQKKSEAKNSSDDLMSRVDTAKKRISKF